MSLSSSNLFLGSIINKQTGSGIVKLTLPNPSGKGAPSVLYGWLAENPTIKLGNIWQPAFPSLDTLTRLSQVMDGTKDTLAWVSGSQSAWAGVEPLTIGFTFYLFSIDQNSTINNDVLNLLSLATIYTSGGSNTEGVIHGGYKPHVFVDNQPTNNSYINNNTDDNVGYVNINIGKKINLFKMLLIDATPEYSSLLVPNGNNLYIKVSANFKSYRPYVTSELQAALNYGGS